VCGVGDVGGGIQHLNLWALYTSIMQIE